MLTSAAASTQTTILPTARATLSMARHGAFPKRFGNIHPRHLTPSYSTLWMGVVSIIWFIAIELLSPDNVLGASLTALGFGIAFYYGITGVACAVFYRHELLKDWKVVMVFARFRYRPFFARRPEVYDPATAGHALVPDADV